MSSHGGVIAVGIDPRQLEPILSTASWLAFSTGSRLACCLVDVGRRTVRLNDDGTIASESLDPDEFDEAVQPFPDRIRSRIEEVLRGTPVEWSEHSLAGGVGAELARLAESEGASMIVVGAHEPGFRGGFREFLNGSVATYLSHVQERPVVVVPWRDVDDAGDTDDAGTHSGADSGHAEKPHGTAGTE